MYTVFACMVGELRYVIHGTVTALIYSYKRLYIVHTLRVCACTMNVTYFLHTSILDALRVVIGHTHEDSV